MNAIPEDLLDQVVDRQTFIQFVQALAAERETAEAIEREDPAAYRVDGALGWKNGDIASFLDGALACLMAQPADDAEPPGWKILAEFLYGGKIYE